MAIQVIELDPDVVHPDVIANLAPIVRIAVQPDGGWMGVNGEGNRYIASGTFSQEKLERRNMVSPADLVTKNCLIIAFPESDEIQALLPSDSFIIWHPLNQSSI